MYYKIIIIFTKEYNEDYYYITGSGGGSALTLSISLETSILKANVCYIKSLQNRLKRGCLFFSFYDGTHRLFRFMIRGL